MQIPQIPSRSPHDAAVHFRVNRHLLDKASGRARAQGVSLSRFLRDAVRKEIDA